LLADLLERVKPADRYARLLAEQAAKARGLIGLLGASEHLARTVLARPELIDQVVSTGASAPDVEEVFALVDATARLAARETPDDPDAVVGALRKVTRETTFAIGLADMAGEIEAAEVSRRLSALAEANVAAALLLAAGECSRRFGTAHNGEPAGGIAVFALGSLAARELSHGGDLDLLFVYDRDGTTAGGTRPGITTGEYAIRVAQRTLSLLSMPHEEGPGYATDMRLRPSGSQGPLVTSRESFERYHAQTAASWEAQALIRVRAIAGDTGLGEVMQSVMDAIAYAPGRLDAGELRRIRARLELELGREDRGELALKYGRGGLLDVEFAVQALQMAHGTDWKLHSPSTREALGALIAGGYLSGPSGRALQEGERLLRAALHATRLTTLGGTLKPAAPSAMTTARRLGYRDRAGQTAVEALLADLSSTREAVRQAHRDVLATVG